MELRHLRYFVAVADQLHFGRAAAKLKISQPSLSVSIHGLEADLQTALFRRTKRVVELTESGRVFLEEAREILVHADRASIAARRARLGQVGQLHVGFAPWMDPALPVAAIAQIHQRLPALSVNLRSMPIPFEVAALRDGRLDVAFIRPPVREISLATEVVTSEPLVAALPSKH